MLPGCSCSLSVCLFISFIIEITSFDFLYIIKPIVCRIIILLSGQLKYLQLHYLKIALILYYRYGQFWIIIAMKLIFRDSSCLSSVLLSFNNGTIWYFIVANVLAVQKRFRLQKVKLVLCPLSIKLSKIYLNNLNLYPYYICHLCPLVFAIIFVCFMLHPCMYLVHVFVLLCILFKTVWVG